MLRTVLQSSATGVAISDFDRRSTWNNRWTCRQQSSRTIRPSPSGVTSGPVSPSAGASPDNIISLMSTPSSVRRGEENSMTTAGDYWMTADIQHRPLDFAAGRRGHRAAHAGPTPSGPCLATAPQAGLVAAAADAARTRAERARDRDLEDAARAAAKKNARRRRAWVVFEDESGLSQ